MILHYALQKYCVMPNTDCVKQSCSNLVCGVLKVKDVCSIKMIPIREGSSELHVCFVSSCKYTHCVVHQLFWLHDTLLCVLILAMNKIN